jgi:hypothetical protein
MEFIPRWLILLAALGVLALIVGAAVAVVLWLSGRDQQPPSAE